MSNPKTTKTPELRYFIIERSALSAYGNENGSDKAEAERLLAESHSEVGDLVVIRGVAMSINPDAIGDGGAAMRKGKTVDGTTLYHHAIQTIHSLRAERDALRAALETLLSNWPESRAGMDYEVLPVGVKAARAALASTQVTNTDASSGTAQPD